MSSGCRVEDDAIVGGGGAVLGADEGEHLRQSQQLVQTRWSVVEDVGKLIETELTQDIFGDSA